MYKPYICDYEYCVSDQGSKIRPQQPSIFPSQDDQCQIHMFK